MAGMLSISLFGGVVGEDTIKVVVVQQYPEKIHTSYKKTLFRSGVIGLIAGMATGYAENRLGVIPGELLSMIMWVMECQIRTEMIGEEVKNLDERKTTENERKIWRIGRLASWIGYLAAYAR